MASKLLFFLFISIAAAAVNLHLKDEKEPTKGTVMVFGGNGFVGRRICEEAVARSYRVVSVSRSGCPHVWRNESWAQKVEWFTADALKINSFKQAMIQRKPVAIFTMIGTASPIKQLRESYDDIFKFAGTTNINVCDVASKVKSIKKFVYIGADVQNMGINPSNANNNILFSLWTQLWYGQYNAKLAVEKCVDDKFGDNGISFRPGVMAGSERLKFFGNLFEFNRLPFYENDLVQAVYTKVIPDVMSVQELAQDSLDFVEGKDVHKFHCPYHSKSIEKGSSGVRNVIVENLDTIIFSVAVAFGVFLIISCLV